MAQSKTRIVVLEFGNLSSTRVPIYAKLQKLFAKRDLERYNFILRVPLSFVRGITWSADIAIL